MKCVLRTREEHGAALVVVLVAVMAMALTAVAAWRASMSSDLAAGNVIAQMQAREAAQAALRDCERALLEDPPTLTVLAAAEPGSRAAWQNAENWNGGGAQARAVRYASPGDPMSAVPPQCLAEWAVQEAGADSAGEGPSVVVVTARGFSADYAVDPQGLALSGATVWLQSTISLEDR